MRIVFMGTPEFAVPSLYKLIMAGNDVALVVTQPDRPRGRGRRVMASPVKTLAEEFGLPVFQPSRLKDPDAIKEICLQEPELIVVVAYGQILPPELLSYPRYGCINLHASLLPAYRGPAPIQRAIMAGETVTGVTTMYMEETLDTGDIILRREVPIEAEITFGELSERLAEIGGGLVLDTVEQIQWGAAPRIPQDESQVSYAPLLKPEDEVIDWSKSAVQIFNQLRALNPRPGAYTLINGVKVKIFRGRVVEDSSQGKAGRVVEVINQEGFVVQTGQGRLLVLEVQREGRKKLSGRDFLKGFTVTPGMELGTGEDSPVCGTP
ncbi:MAG: methionyl-tRNA formyltransferase [Syntrophomonadaceae bacterium]|nr:methionyl-tRNA formyltransferase [Syntrophomonadaceae bacterium]